MLIGFGHIWQWGVFKINQKMTGFVLVVECPKYLIRKNSNADTVFYIGFIAINAN